MLFFSIHPPYNSWFDHNQSNFSRDFFSQLNVSSKKAKIKTRQLSRLASGQLRPCCEGNDPRRGEVEVSWPSSERVHVMLRIRHFFRVKKKQKTGQTAWLAGSHESRILAASPLALAITQCFAAKTKQSRGIRMQKAEGCLIFQACCCSLLAVEGPTAVALIRELTRGFKF